MTPINGADAAGTGTGASAPFPLPPVLPLVAAGPSSESFEATHPLPVRDAWEDAQLAEAIAIELPFLGICRGVQVLNVALGGTLHQHLPDVVGSERYQPSPAVFGSGEVTVEPDSRLAALLGPDSGTLPVHYYHHQALDEVADGLTVTARSEDGVIEAVELDGVPFGLGVQWHPEEDAADRRLFAGLVDAARTHRTRRSRS